MTFASSVTDLGGLILASNKGFPRERQSGRWIATVVVGISAVLSARSVEADDFTMPSPSETNRPATHDLAALKSKVDNMYHALRAVAVRYRHDVHDPSPSTLRVPTSSYWYAYKGERRLREQSLPDGKIYTFAFNEDVQQYYNKQIQQVALQEKKEELVDVDAYIYAIGIPLSAAERATAPNNAQFLPYCLEKGTWRVLPLLQLIDDRECHVLESSDRHRFWIDAERGVIMYRERFQRLRNKEPADWPLFERMYFSRHVDCRDGIILPTLVKIDGFASVQSVLDVEEIRVNDDVSDDQFTLKVPDGTRVADHRTKEMYIVGDQVAGLDLLIAEQSEIAAARRRSRFTIVGINLAVIALIVGIAAGRRFYRKSR